MSFTEKDLGQVFDEIEAEQSDHLVKIAKMLSTEAREELPKKEFAVPGKEAYPIPDIAHARNALARVSQHGSPAEREMVRKKVYAKYPELKEGFEERTGESPTSKENVKKEEQGQIGKEGALREDSWIERRAIKAHDAYAEFMNKAIDAKTKNSEEFGVTAAQRDDITRKYNKLIGSKIPMAKDYKGLQSFIAMAKKEDEDGKTEKCVGDVSNGKKREERLHHMSTLQSKFGSVEEGAEKKAELQIGKFQFAKEAQVGSLTATMGEKGEAIGAAAGLVAGAAIGAATGGKGNKVVSGLLGSLLGTMAGAAGGRIGGSVAETVGRETEPGVYTMGKRREAAKSRMAGTPLGEALQKKGSDGGGPTFDFINAVSEQMKKEGAAIPVNIAQSPETSPQEKAKILAMQQQMKAQKAQPKAAGFLIGGVKVGMGEDSAAEELGFSNATAESVKGDQESAGQDLIGAKIPTATSEHLKQVANPPKGTDDFFRQKVAEEIDKVAQYTPTPSLPMQRGGGPTRIIYYPMREPGLGDKAKSFMQSHPEAYPLIGAGLGALGGGLLGEQVASPGATTAGVGLGAAGGAALGELYGHRQRQQKKRAEFIIGGEKIGAEKPGKVSEKDLKRVFEASVRRSGSPVRRKFLWDVGDVVGKKKDKEEYKPGVMVQTPVYKRAQERPRNPMMEGGDVRFTAGPIPEDVAKYLRTQATGEQVGELAGTGVGALGGGAVGHAGGEMVGGALEQAGHPLAGRLSRILGTLGGGVAGGLAGRAVGKRMGRGIGGAVAEKLTPASQITVPFLTPSRAEFIGGRLAAAPAMEAGRTPTVAISPG